MAYPTMRGPACYNDNNVHGVDRFLSRCLRGTEGYQDNCESVVTRAVQGAGQLKFY
ncbi:protein of unknown function [Pseudorhizobium banfieldiae]|uniref:Uncharacterized protein n=1 Tax=Pseudorhizobium banfieldiae TaxID=1125847 RepID=L0NBR9_9HYPH|nr:protein of unknown function [Pseudorhizobium banfieldiae]